jgi:hypothetical protein
MRIGPSVSADPSLLPQSGAEGLAQSQTAVLHGVVRVHFQVAVAPQRQVQHRVPGEQRQHVIEKRDPGLDGRATAPVDLQLEPDPGLLRHALQLRLTFLHFAQLTKAVVENKAQIPWHTQRVQTRLDGHEPAANAEFGLRNAE